MDESYLPLMEAASFLGCSRVKLSKLTREGIIKFITTPMDKRTKLFAMSDLKKLKSLDPRNMREK